MTKKELLEMLKDVPDDANLTFVESSSDRDGYPFDKGVKIYKVLGGEVVTVKGNYGIERLENKTDDLVYVEKTNLAGIKYGWYEKSNN
jgi:hypothetical protein